MASSEELQALHDLGPETELNDAELGALFDVLGMNATLARLWETRAAKTATLVDTSESGSSRKMSDIHRNALAYATRYRAQAEAESPTPQASATATTVLIQR